jgi:iron complex transport system permease protein
MRSALGAQAMKPMKAMHANEQPLVMTTHGRYVVLFVVLLLLTIALLPLGAAIGSMGYENLLPSIWSSTLDEASKSTALRIVLDIRLPRTVGAWCAGALLGLAGALAQGLFRNPLADPYLLGSASGASLGVAAALAGMGGTGMLAAGAVAMPAWGAFSGPWLVRLGLTGAAFIGAVLAVLLTLALARGVQHTLRLLLAGVIVGVVLGALTSLLLLISPHALQTMQAFMLGSTSFVGWPACGLMATVWLLCLLVAWVGARGLDGLALGNATAHSLGLPLSALRAILVAVLALATGTAVAQTGLIAFVGLAAPHVVRALVPLSHRRLAVLSSFMGGVLLASADLLARGLMYPQELPVGVITAIMGGGYLLWLMHRRANAGDVL